MNPLLILELSFDKDIFTGRTESAKEKEELENYECGDKVLELYKLVDTLFDRDLS